MRLILEERKPVDLKPGDRVLCTVCQPFAGLIEVLGVHIDRAADHPLWQGDDQVRVTFEGGTMMFQGTVPVLLAVSEPGLLVIPSEAT